MSNIIYKYGGSLYLNITNKCPCACTFCLREQVSGVGTAENLWLESEPNAEQVISLLVETQLHPYEEIVFCGFGEPFCALDTLLNVCRYLHGQNDCPPVRINTNGLGDLINGKPTSPLLEGLVDVISISLNAHNKAKYNELCKPSFGECAFDAMLKFAAECKEYIPDVRFSVVDVISGEDIEKCRKIAREMGIPLRVRVTG